MTTYSRSRELRGSERHGGVEPVPVPAGALTHGRQDAGVQEGLLPAAVPGRSSNARGNSPRRWEPCGAWIVWRVVDVAAYLLPAAF